MASSAGSSEDAELNQSQSGGRAFDCPVCFELLKDPRTLNCGHSLCQTCIQQIQKCSAKQIRIPCPECRRDTKIDKNKELGKTYMLTDAIERERKLREKLSAAQENSAQMKAKIRELLQCASCEAKETADKMVVCGECPDGDRTANLCHTCYTFKHHGHPRPTSLVEIADKQRAKWTAACADKWKREEHTTPAKFAAVEKTVKLLQSARDNLRDTAREKCSDPFEKNHDLSTRMHSLATEAVSLVHASSWSTPGAYQQLDELVEKRRKLQEEMDAHDVKCKSLAGLLGRQCHELREWFDTRAWERDVGAYVKPEPQLAVLATDDNNSVTSSLPSPEMELVADIKPDVVAPSVVKNKSDVPTSSKVSPPAFTSQATHRELAASLLKTKPANKRKSSAKYLFNGDSSEDDGGMTKRGRRGKARQSLPSKQRYALQQESDTDDDAQGPSSAFQLDQEAGEGSTKTGQRARLSRGVSKK